MTDDLPHGRFELQEFLKEHVPDYQMVLLDPVGVWNAFDWLRKAGRSVKFIPARHGERSLAVRRPGGKLVDCGRVEIDFEIKPSKKRRRTKACPPKIYQGGAPGSGKKR